jgi:hypothetical protein
MATAACFSQAASRRRPRERRAEPAIFRLVVSSNGRAIPLDYNTSASDEMTRQHDSTQERNADMTAKAADKLKSDGWKIVETTGFLHLIRPL